MLISSKTFVRLLILFAIFLFSRPAQAKYAGGSGTADDPYQIATAADLIALGETPEDYDKHFILTADIDLDPNLPGRKVFERAVIAPDTNPARAYFQGTPFIGVFEGNGHTVSHLTITGKDYLGLFGFLESEAEVKDLGVVDVKITASGSYVGGLVGSNGRWDAEGGTVTGCYSTGSVSGDWRVGGLVGSNVGTVTQCYSAGAVSGNGTNVGAMVLGLLGACLLPDRPAKGQETADVPIPELRRWEENMKKYGVKHGTERGYMISPGYASEAYVWYYDGARVFYQIADYTDDPKWSEFAENCMETYRRYVFSLNGKVPGWRVFPHGLYLHFKRTGNEKSKEAAVLLSKNSPYAAVGGRPGEEHSREAAYCINAYLVAEALGERRHPKLEQAVEYALGHIDQWFVQNSSQNWAPFMFGLTCEALIAYHDKVRKDPRILPPIKMGLDECWKRAWIEEKQAFFYRADNPTGAAPGLNLLVAPAFAWVYLQTGDTTYRDRGDKVFAGGVRGAWLDGGKQFSQNYRWSFDYVKWRTEAERRRFGGLVGSNGGTVTDCYSTGTVSGGSYVGGLVGYNYGGEVIQSFWDIQTSGKTYSAGGTGKTTTQMQTASTFLDVGWDFVGETANGTEDIWWILEGKDYPRLWWEAAEP